METERILRRESLVGKLLIVLNSVWIFAHWHRASTKLSDLFVAIAAIGAIFVLRAEFKLGKLRSN